MSSRNMNLSPLQSYTLTAETTFVTIQPPFLIDEIYLTQDATLMFGDETLICEDKTFFLLDGSWTA